MFNKLVDECRPSLSFSHLRDICFADLVREGIYFVILDVDNTIAMPGKGAATGMSNLLRIAREEGIRDICLLSNVVLQSEKKVARIRTIAHELGMDKYLACYWPNLKPKEEPFRRALGLLGSSVENTAVIGDQCFTDIRGGNNLSMVTILVSPLGSDHFVTRPKRQFESYLRNVYSQRR